MHTKNEFDQLVGQPVPHWQGAKKPSAKTMQGQFGYLEKIENTKDAEALFRNINIENQGESWTYLPYGPFVTLPEFCDWINKTIAEPDTQLFTIFNLQHVPVGVAGYLRINPDHGVIEVGHLHYSKLLQRTPLATEAMFLMMQHAFDQWGYRRYEWKCNSLNEPSRQAALRLGFQFEGIFRQSNVLKGFNRDTAWFSIIDSEWTAIKEKFKRWLRPENFDSNGKQRKKLSEVC
jgi:RimJ/RimL family protein N-acetyltransferase